MSLAIGEEHRSLEQVARSFLEDRKALQAARELLDAEHEVLPQFWKELCSLGWLGLHLPEDYGGEGYGLAELALVISELGRVVAPGPFLPTVLASAVLVESATEAQRARWIPQLASGSQTGAVGLSGSLERADDGLVSGETGPILGAGLADVLLLPSGDDLVLVDRHAPGVTLAAGPQLDPTRRSARARCQETPPLAVLAGARPVAVKLARILTAAEAAGGARACSEAATGYAKVREQFGRTIGSFQAVKHHCANMAIDAEVATALAWDAARAEPVDRQQGIAAAAAAAAALPAYQRCARLNIQIHGGIGFTWEHDAHLYLRRAEALASLVDPVVAAQDTTDFTADGVVRRPGLGLPSEAAQYRAQVRDFVRRLAGVPPQDHREVFVESGYLVPHWPAPWGRGASAVEQLVIEEELAEVERADLGIGGWILLTLVQEGNDDQRQRWIRPGLLGEKVWCQLFSEPGAGSDAAAVSTRAEKVEGGWRISGQKVWTSGAHYCDFGLATVRTDPAAPKHAGVTMMAVDLHADGVQIRPLREITGDALFNEVFLDEVFVPDANVVGSVGQGWKVARATLGNERVTIGGGYSGTAGTALELVPRLPEPSDLTLVRELGALIAERLAIQALNLRVAARAVTGARPGPEGSITKLLTAEHAQRVADLGMRVCGSDALDGTTADVAHGFLFARCLTIAGGTSEILRNQIAERILKLPRDPTPP